MDDDRLSIGQFSRLTGVSIGALRHYDELDLLRPAEVDPFTGYRRYRREHVAVGRAVARLRDLQVLRDEIRPVLASDDPALQSRRIADHRSRIEARVNRLQRVLHVLGQLSAGRERGRRTTGIFPPPTRGWPGPPRSPATGRRRRRGAIVAGRRSPVSRIQPTAS